MIPYPRSEGRAESLTSVRVIGIGNAGVHFADRIFMAAIPGLDVVVMNTDTQSLASSVCEQKVTLGRQVTRGLGAGGDPEVGAEAARESLDEIRAAVTGADLVFLCAGLGGGTASGAVPAVADYAREAGATVFALVTSPFAFEGKRRAAQAAAALDPLTRHAHVVLHFENDRMAEITSPRAGIEETFSVSDAMLAAAITGLSEILRGGGPMPVGIGDLLAAVGGAAPAGIFGRGESSGENRAHEALERALKSPLLDRGRMLAECRGLIAHVSGPPSLSFSEVAAVMRELVRHTAEDAQLYLGVTTADASAPLSVTLFGNCGPAPARAAAPHPVATERRPAPAVQAPPAPEPAAEAVPEPTAEPPAESAPLFPESAPPDKPAPVVARAPREPRPAKPAVPPKAKQETLPFESAARGRFEKSEPTIVEGEDLDVPTFLRLRGKS